MFLIFEILFFFEVYLMLSCLCDFFVFFFELEVVELFVIMGLLLFGLFLLFCVDVEIDLEFFMLFIFGF